LNAGIEIEAAAPAELVLPPDASLALVADQLVAQARTDGVALTGEGGLLTGLIQRVLQGALEAEISEHLGYEPHAVDGRGSGNSLNDQWKLRRLSGGVGRRDPDQDP